MEVDRTELHDIAAHDDTRVANLEEMYLEWTREVGVAPWDEVLPKLLEAWNLSSVDG